MLHKTLQEFSNGKGTAALSCLALGQFQTNIYLVNGQSVNVCECFSAFMAHPKLQLKTPALLGKPNYKPAGAKVACVVSIASTVLFFGVALSP